MIKSIHSFGGAGDGIFPFSSLIVDAEGDLFGTGVAGGASSCQGPSVPGCGIAYELVPGSGGYTERILHSFSGAPDGANPYAELLAGTRGKLYGVTGYRGTGPCASPGRQHGCGTVFQLDLGDDATRSGTSGD